MAGPLAEPVVPAGAYDEAYYRRVCAGAEVWEASAGGALDPRYAGSLARSGMCAGDVLVDVGCGRGELLVVAARMGAKRAIGVEYSRAAVALAHETIARAEAGGEVEVLLADARALPLPDRSADLVTLLDVVEHLAPAELATALVEARRVLRPGGRVFVHTMPNRLVFSVTYRLQRAARRERRRDWPADPRTEHERLMHVNEQTALGLRRAMRSAGFVDVRVRTGEWIRDDVLPDPRAGRLLRRLARIPVLRHLGAADLWAEGRRPAGARRGRPGSLPTS